MPFLLDFSCILLKYTRVTIGNQNTNTSESKRHWTVLPFEESAALFNLLNLLDLKFLDKLSYKIGDVSFNEYYKLL